MPKRTNGSRNRALILHCRSDGLLIKLRFDSVPADGWGIRGKYVGRERKRTTKEAGRDHHETLSPYGRCKLLCAGGPLPGCRLREPGCKPPAVRLALLP